ncbi:TlyA family RNA methyltransferase [Pseudothermotoga thermarum]|uniref:Hemolysin A n=1 Tax=Pseudothermotoga thermarum DSM 5069 TaxID=688269 RepID=F7YYT6_9THEM|nr:TlyA family RNA methyltransferase [Pseudothermotoga thermarum]AEH51124.1 hemolysin A [Pseudothermotoga thermarum DSM 5069]
MRIRLDLLLVKKGLAKTRSQARDLIKLGRVYVNNSICKKPGKLVDEQTEIKLSSERIFASRGGEKLQKAYETFEIDFEGKIVCDIGASTGGFTHFALLHGAKKVYAVDVGTNQLAEFLRKDPKVVCMENQNAKDLRKDLFEEEIDIVLCDVSFISVTQILGQISSILKEEGDAVILVKPQFEVGYRLRKNKGAHFEAIKRVIEKAQEFGLIAVNVTYSPLTGGDGDIEYFLHLKKKNMNPIDDKVVLDTVEKAWEKFRGELG